MSETKNGKLDQYVAEFSEQQQFRTADAEGVRTFDNVSDNFVALISNAWFIIKKTLCCHFVDHPVYGDNEGMRCR